MADNGVQEVNPATGALRQVVRGALAFPSDIAIQRSPRGDTLLVADVFSYRAVDAATGKVRDLGRMHADELEYPTSVSVGPKHVILGGGVAGVVQVMDAESGRRLRHLEGFKGPAGALELPNGDLVVLESTGDLIRVTGEQRRKVASGLQGVTSLAMTRDGSVLVAEAGAGRITRVNLDSGAKTVFADGFKRPKALAVGPRGEVVVLDLAERSVTEITARGARRTIARDLPVGLLPASPFGAGIAVGSRGAIYVASDVENAIYRIDR